VNYNYNHLYYFYIAAKSGGITKASEHLHISQPSLSSQLKVLEESLDLKLFEKVGRRNQLTPSGIIIYEYCKQMFELAEKMTEVISKGTPTSKRKIHIGVSNDVEKEFISEVVSNFLNRISQEQRPQVNLLSGPLNQLLDHLHFKEIDTVITAQKINNSEFISLEEASVPVVLCCSSKWQNITCTSLADNDLVISELAKCKNIQWVLPSSSFELRTQIDKFFNENQIEKRVIFESDNIATLVRSVHNELGFSFLPLLHVATEIKGNYLKCLGSNLGFWDYHITLGCHPLNKEDSLVKAFSKSFRDLCEQANPTFKKPISSLEIH
jgi:LysR family transcriptional activator of nhaA